MASPEVTSSARFAKNLAPPHAFQNLSTCFILRYNKQTNIVPSFQEQYPTYLSLIETEEMEAMSIINLLKFLNAQYVDIWFHPHSETAAHYVYEQYVLKVTLNKSLSELTITTDIFPIHDSCAEGTNVAHGQINFNFTMYVSH